MVSASKKRLRLWKVQHSNTKDEKNLKTKQNWENDCNICAYFFWSGDFCWLATHMLSSSGHIPLNPVMFHTRSNVPCIYNCICKIGNALKINRGKHIVDQKKKKHTCKKSTKAQKTQSQFMQFWTKCTKMAEAWFLLFWESPDSQNVLVAAQSKNKKSTKN